MISNLLILLDLKKCLYYNLRAFFVFIGMEIVNPFFRTFPPLQLCKGGFLLFASLPTSVVEKFKLAELLENMPKPPYNPARLVNEDKPITVRWYIVFWAWNSQVNELQRKRLYEVNKFKTKAERLAFAKKEIKAINALLASGMHINPKEKKKQEIKKAANNPDYTIDEAFRYILKIVKSTKRPETFRSYNSVGGLFLRYCEDAGWIDWKIRSLDKTDIITWLDQVKINLKGGEEKDISNKTRNNYKSFISAIFAMMVERNILERNPAFGIKQVDADDGGNIAYTPAQIDTLKNAIQAKKKRLWLFITFMLYGFIRPGEIGRLQVKMIDIDKNTIFLPGTITKNRKPRHVKISGAFKKYVLELKLQEHAANCFVFGFNLETCTRQIQKNYANKLHHDIARPLGFGEEYTLYSWKHTGVVIHYKAGIDIKTLQAQIGHQSLEETDIYLKSLNLYENTEIEDKSPVI